MMTCIMIRTGALRVAIAPLVWEALKLLRTEIGQVAIINLKIRRSIRLMAALGWAQAKIAVRSTNRRGLPNNSSKILVPPR